MDISIHAPREGSDSTAETTDAMLFNFYPRSPRGERLETAGIQGVHQVFLSTLPARGATRSTATMPHTLSNFYPRSPRGERLMVSMISIPIPLFLSTLPARGATAKSSRLASASVISIHAPREGSDPYQSRERL